MKETKGIALIALVVTLVVLLILATITINAILGDNGIFKTANDAKIQHWIGEILDELNVAESSVSLQKLGKQTLEEYIQYIQDQNIVAQVEEQEDGSYLVTTEDGYMFQISIVEGKDDNSWKIAEESKNNTCNITGLAGNQIYDGVNEASTANVTVTITAGSDNESGADKIRYNLSGAQTIAETTTTSGTTSKSITISAEGTSTAYTIDKAGNVSEAKTQVINLISGQNR